jgi:hypothetical protein
MLVRCLISPFRNTEEIVLVIDAVPHGRTHIPDIHSLIHKLMRIRIWLIHIL